MGRAAGLVLFALAYFVLLELMLAAAVLFWPEFTENLASLRSMASAIPILGEQVQKIEEHGFPAYTLAQHFFKGCNALGVAAAVLFAAPAIAGDAHRGTLELVLARPLSRRRILLVRWCGGALALTVPVIASTLTIPLLAERVDEVQAYGPYLACALHQSLFLLAIYAVTFLISSVGTNPNRIAMGVLFVAVFQFALYMIKTVTHWSLFRLCDLDVLIALYDEGEWHGPITAALVGAVVLALAGSLAAFARRTP
jgi:ABC-type transport system involved in multi-copper enzyme maturation permease subunit